MRIGLILLACAVTLTSSCARAPKVYHEQFIGFGTLVDITLYDVSLELGQQAVSAIATDIEYLHKAWHPWHAGALGRINELLPSGEFFSIAPSILPLIKESKRLSQESDGLFNPAIGQLIRLWGFANEDPPHGPPPAAAAIAELVKKAPRMEDIELNGIEIRSRNDSVILDFGGFAKGYAVDMAIDRLREMGIKNAIVNAGGDLRAIGRHGDRPWRVGIRNPRGEGVLASVEVQGDECVFTSGDYERYYDYEGKRYHHIIDPRSGYPAQGTSSVTVLDDRGGDADAAATALFIAGPQNWYRIAKSMGVSGVMLVETNGKIHMTPNLKDRIHFELGVPQNIEYSDPL